MSFFLPITTSAIGRQCQPMTASATVATTTGPIYCEYGVHPWTSKPGGESCLEQATGCSDLFPWLKNCEAAVRSVTNYPLWIVTAIDGILEKRGQIRTCFPMNSSGNGALVFLYGAGIQLANSQPGLTGVESSSKDGILSLPYKLSSSRSQHTRRMPRWSNPHLLHVKKKLLVNKKNARCLWSGPQ